VKLTLPASLVASGNYEEFAQGPGKRHGRSNSLKWPWLYDKLRAKGYDKSKAAAISNSRIHLRKKGRLSVLPAKAAHNTKVLKRLAEYDKSGKHATKGKLTKNVRLSGNRTEEFMAFIEAHDFACHSKACAPPPVGKGGSTNIATRKAIKNLNQPDSGFTLSTKLAPLRSGFAVALNGSDKLVAGASAFKDGKPSPQLVSMVRDRINAAIGTNPPKGTKVGIGGWNNPADGKVEVNVTVVFPKTQREKAIKFAQEQDQIAIYGLHNGDLIMTGGTGGERATA
jgi:hypothetical protein